MQTKKSNFFYAHWRYKSFFQNTSEAKTFSEDKSWSKAEDKKMMK